MGASTRYLGLPRVVFDQFRADDECFELLAALWHYESGAWHALFDGFQSALREDGGGYNGEWADVLKLADAICEDPCELFRRYGALIERANREHPTIEDESAWLDESHEYHEMMLSEHFRKRGFTDSAELAAIAVSGGDGGESAGELWCIDEGTTWRIGRALHRVDRLSLLAALPELAEKKPPWCLHGLSSDDREQRLGALSSDEYLVTELECLVDLYTNAARRGHIVVLG